MGASARLQAVSVLSEVLGRGRSLTVALERLRVERAGADDDGSDFAQIQGLAFDVLRSYPLLEVLLRELLARPLKARDADVQSTLAVGLYLVLDPQTPDYAAVNTAVDLTKALGKPWAARLVNGVLRTFVRERETLLARVAENEAAATRHPLWLVQALRADWPKAWGEVVAAGNARPPMSLRVNRARLERGQFARRLEEAGIHFSCDPWAPAGLTLARPRPVGDVPGFGDGEVSVQDISAQLAAELLAPRSGHRVLDACAAPGGKTAAIAERAAAGAEDIDLVALDIDATRLERVGSTLGRLGLPATLGAADAAALESWWDGRPFDRILLDAPCTGSGVIRRHPDIKRLRRPSDMSALGREQRRLLDSLWTALRPGGRLLYATCSVLKVENEALIAGFCRDHVDAVHRPIDADWGIDRPFGRQILSTPDGPDGFYYCLLSKEP